MQTILVIHHLLNNKSMNQTVRCLAMPTHLCEIAYKNSMTQSNHNPIHKVLFIMVDQKYQCKIKRVKMSRKGGVLHKAILICYKLQRDNYNCYKIFPIQKRSSHIEIRQQYQKCLNIRITNWTKILTILNHQIDHHMMGYLIYK